MLPGGGDYSPIGHPLLELPAPLDHELRRRRRDHERLIEGHILVDNTHFDYRHDTFDPSVGVDW